MYKTYRFGISIYSETTVLNCFLTGLTKLTGAGNAAAIASTVMLMFDDALLIGVAIEL
jgi:hypothetical protein